MGRRKRALATQGRVCSLHDLLGQAGVTLDEIRGRQPLERLGSQEAQLFENRFMFDTASTLPAGRISSVT